MALAEVIADSSRLIRLDLRENEIKSGGLMALSLSLKMNYSVTRYALDSAVLFIKLVLTRLLIVARRFTSNQRESTVGPRCNTLIGI